MADRLNEMMARLELAFGQRQQFLADAAHELRTPIAALMTNLEVTLRKPRDADTLISALRTSLTDVKLLRRLIERLMEHVRANTTAAQKPAERLNVSALLDECARLAESIAQAKEVDIIRDYANDIFFTTQADRLRSVAMNLLANAIEYNRPGGTVTLSAHLSAKDLQISIADSGPGIAPHDLAHIFEPFYRGDVSHRPDGDHLGLGLFLVRSHIQAMGGACSVESEPGKGTVFHITLPQSATDAAPLVLAPIH